MNLLLAYIIAGVATISPAFVALLIFKAREQKKVKRLPAKHLSLTLDAKTLAKISED